MTYAPTLRGTQRAIMRDVWCGKVDEFFAEYVRITPMRTRGVNFPQEPDPTRREITVPAVFRAPSADVLAMPTDQQPRKLGVVQSKPTFNIAEAALPYQLRHRDLIVRCKTGETFECQAPIKDALWLRVSMPVVQLGVPSGASASDL